MREVARALEMVEGISGIRLDVPPSGQFYPRAFLPDESWRERAARPFQPWEIQVTSDGSNGWRRVLVQVEEDWSGEGMDPRLVPHEHPLASWSELPTLIGILDDPARPLGTALVFCPDDLPMMELFTGLRPLMTRLPKLWIFPERKDVRP